MYYSVNKREYHGMKKTSTFRRYWFLCVIKIHVTEIPYARSTRPDLRQDVHTYIFFEPPSVFTRTDFMFDFHIFGVFL